MNRPLFLQPWYVRARRSYRLRQSMAEHRHSDPSESRISIPKVIFWTVIVCVVAAAYYLGEAVERKRQQRMEGLYSPSPRVIQRLDCSPEGAIACRAQRRMEPVKGKSA